jgi:putative PIN family toxin of toxin-antitoxin system
MIVIDTNIVLDAFVFDDPGSVALKAALEGRQIRWLATRPMRDELERVLAYPLIVRRLLRGQRGADEVLAQFDAKAEIVEVAARAPMRCRDPDDQKFVDLALAHKAALLSKDRALLCLSKRLLAQGVRVQSSFEISP